LIKYIQYIIILVSINIALPNDTTSLSIEIQKYIDKFNNSILSYIPKNKENHKRIDRNLPIQIKLNTKSDVDMEFTHRNPHAIYKQEWIPYIDDQQISQSMFWRLIGNEEKALDWHKKEKLIKRLKKHRFHILRFIPLTIGAILGFSQEEKKEVNQTYSIDGGINVSKKGYEYHTTDGDNMLTYTSLLWLSYEIINPLYGQYLRRVKYRKELPITNQVSYIEVKEIVDCYNQNKIDLKGNLECP